MWHPKLTSNPEGLKTNSSATALTSEARKTKPEDFISKIPLLARNKVLEFVI